MISPRCEPTAGAMLYNFLESTDAWLDDIGLFSVFQVLYQLEFRAFMAVVCSFTLVVLFGRRTIRWLVKKKIGDSPEFYRADLGRGAAGSPTLH